MPNSIDLENIIDYYDGLLEKHTNVSRAVGWRNAESQKRKFFEIAQVFAHESRPFTVYDVGCGLGSLYDFLKDTNRLARYYGCDINPRMIGKARQRNGRLAVECRNLLLSPPKKQFDYVLGSGIFNLRMRTSKRAWKEYIYQMLMAMYGMTKRGMAIGFLSTFARREEPDEYHQNPSEMLEFVQNAISPLAEVRHSLSPGHFAIFVYRSLPLKSISRLRGPSLKSKSMIDKFGTNAPKR